MPGLARNTPALAALVPRPVPAPVPVPVRSGIGTGAGTDAVPETGFCVSKLQSTPAVIVTVKKGVEMSPIR